MREITKSAKRSFVVLSLYYAAVSACIIIFGSPLFRVLSFEYASLVALFGSLPVMWFAARYAQEHRDQNFLSALMLIPVPALLLPIMLSLIFVRSCDLLYGLSYYVQIVFPSTLIGLAFGTACGLWAKKRWTRIAAVIAVWVLTFAVSLVPGYVSQRIFTYGWQYGYFPGLVWDEYIALGERYWESLVTYFIFAMAAVLLVTPRAASKRQWGRIAAILLVALLIGLRLINDRSVVGGLSHSEVETRLFAEFRVGSVTVHTAKITDEERGVLEYSIRQALQEIKAIYASVDTTRPLDIYIYPHSDMLYEFVGTRRASIAKPWLGTLHIARENLSSLKHELVHVLLASHGNFPFSASWITGLTEGSAVAVEDEYDGLRTADDLAALALRMGYVSGVADLMQFTGFASTAASASYILTGSFSKHLIAKYGSEKYLQLYHTREYEAIYGKDLAALEEEWKRSTLTQAVPLTARDSTIAQYYFDRTSIVNQACLRRIGRLLHEARKAYHTRKYQEAYTLYQRAYSEDSTRIDALRGMVLANVKQRKFASVAELINTDPAMRKATGKVLLGDMRGDMAYFAHGATSEMKTRYDEAIDLAPNDVRYISAVGMRMLLEDPLFNVRKYLEFRYDLDTTRQSIPQSLYEQAWESPMPDSIRLGYVLLRTLHNEARSEYAAAVHEWDALPVFVDSAQLSPRLRRAYDIVDKKVNVWRKALDRY